MTTNAIELYSRKKTDLEGALRAIRSEDFMIAAMAGSEPIPLLEQIHRLKALGVRDCQLTNCLPMRDYEFIKSPEYKDTIFTAGWFYSGIMRRANQQGNVSFAPQHLHNSFTKRLFARDGRRLVLLCTCSPMDRHGYLSLSLGTTYERQAIEEGAFVIAVVNNRMPRTFGDTIVHIREIDLLVEVDYEVPTLPISPINDKDRKIGGYIAELVEEGSTIQLGIGGIPNAVAEALKEKRHLGIHTEMLTEGMVDLIEAGAVDNTHKTLYKGKTVATFALGGKRLYDFIDDNPSVIFKYGKWTNSPYVIGQNHKMVSINTTLEVDLTGQCASESIGPLQFSGTGGQSDTAIGAQLSEGGRSFIALYSTTDIRDMEGNKTTISKISPMLKTGAAVSLSRNDVDIVVTEYGAVSLRGRTIKERADRLISIAHPEFREKLRFEAKQLGAW